MPMSTSTAIEVSPGVPPAAQQARAAFEASGTIRFRRVLGDPASLSRSHLLRTLPRPRSVVTRAVLTG
jgi:hypothetical protein